MKRPLKCFGDSDILMHMGMYKVGQHFFSECVPQANEVVKFLSESDKLEIFNQNSIYSQIEG